MSEKICPLMSHRSIEKGPHKDITVWLCREEECAWWIERAEYDSLTNENKIIRSCAIKRLAEK